MLNFDTIQITGMLSYPSRQALAGTYEGQIKRTWKNKSVIDLTFKLSLCWMKNVQTVWTSEAEDFSVDILALATTKTFAPLTGNPTEWNDVCGQPVYTAVSSSASDTGFDAFSTGKATIAFVGPQVEVRLDEI